MTLKCPKCKSSWKFEVNTTQKYIVDKNEVIIDYLGFYKWDDDSCMTCKACGHDATAREFRSRDEIRS